MNIPELIKEAHDNAVERGFYVCVECGGSGYDENTLIAITNKPHPKCPICNGSKINPNKNIGELLMLIVSELGEALEAHRSGKFADWKAFKKFLADEYSEVRNYWYEVFIKNTFEDEIADVFIRLFDLCAYLEIDTNEEFFLYGYETIRDITENTANELLEIVEDIISIKKETDDLKSAAIKSMIGFSLARLNCFCTTHNIPIEKHIRAKMAYNRTRPHKHNKEY